MNNRPPRFASWLLDYFSRQGATSYYVGDFEEAFQAIAEQGGSAKAKRWYRRQVVRSLPGLVLNSIYWSAAMFKNYLKIAYRNITKNKVYSAINILGFAVGLASFILIALYVQYEFNYDTYHINAENIYRAVRNKPSGESGEITKTSVTPAPLAPLLRDELPEVINATRITIDKNVLLEYKNESFLEPKTHWVDPETFKIFTIPLIDGDSQTALDDPYSMLLSESMAKKIFGNEDPIGKTVNLYNNYDFEVTGIFYDMPANSHFVMDIVLPYTTFFKMINRDVASWSGNFTYTYLLLQENFEFKELISKLPALFDKHIYKKYNINIEDKYKEVVTLQPITDIHLYSQRNQEMEANGNAKSVIMLGSIALLFLLIACINYMNLSTAKSGQRGKEVGLRKVIGAHRKQLIYQFFGESMVITILAFILSVIIVVLLLPSFNQFVERSLSLNPFGNSLLLGGMLILVIVVGLFAGSFPAIMISGFSPISVLRGTFSRTATGATLRNILVLVQFSITIIFFTFTFVVKEQIQFILNKNLGYDKEQIITINIRDRNIIKKMETVKQELIQHPGVVMASASYCLPNNIDEHQGFQKAGSNSGLRFMIYYNFADYDYADLFGIEIIEGRNFSRDFPSDKNGAFLINEAAVKAAGWDNPIGDELSTWANRTGKIVGIMKDFHAHSLHRSIEPVYIYLNPDAVSYLSIKILPTDVPLVLEHIKQVIEKFSPDYPFSYSFFDEVFAAAYKTEQKMEVLFSAFATLAAIVACLGLFGLAAYAAENRTKEIGIRKALGASVSNIYMLLSREFLKWVLLANIIAWPIAYFFMRRWLDDFAYRTDLNIWMFVLSGIIALGIALVTVSRQSQKSARTNPVEALKYE